MDPSCEGRIRDRLGKDLLKSLGVEGEYEGIGHCALGYVDGEYPQAAERKEKRIFAVK